MKKVSFLLMTLVLVLVLAACGQKNNAEPSQDENAGAEEVTLKIGASPVPHAEVLEFIKPVLKEKGINLEILVFNDYVQPNTQLYEKNLDVDYFQHVPYMDQFNTDHGYDLVNVGGVHIEPFGAYSQKVKTKDELKEGAKIAIPNDPSNSGRSLALMAREGLLTLKDGVGVKGTLNDIVDNPKKFEFVEVEAATLPRILGDVDMALINTNYALEADLVPTKDALFIEDSNSPYVNIITARPDNKDNAAIKTLVETLQTPEVKKFIEEKYKGAVVPAFE